MITKQSPLSLFLAGLTLVFGGLFWALPAAAEVSDLDSIVAVVNDDVITRSELETELNELLLQINPDPDRLPPRRVLEGQVLERIIADRLQLQAAEQAGIGVDDQTLAQAINNIAANNDLTLAELSAAMAADGMDFGQFRESVRKEIILSRLRNQEVINRINVSEQEIDNYLDKELVGIGGRTEYRLYHIRIGLPEAATPDEIRRARAQAEQLVGQLRAGGDFQQAAMTYSDGRQALEGGDLGWRKANELPTLFTDIVVDMQRGEISDPVQSASGFHIILLADFKGSDRQIIRQTHARHILINTNEITSDNDARLRLEQLKKRIEGGDDFGALARSNSDDTASAIKGGDLGWVSGGDLVPIFEERMNALSPGQVSEPFRTQFGWHIVQVIERREYDNTNEVLRAKAREAIRERKATEAGELWLRRLRDEAYVEIRLDAERI
jgi:peptidyl-prolyl cis-trans isomerase SurA